MLLATVLATLVMLDVHGGFGGHQGFPFAWHWWTDVIIEGRPVGGYRWGGLAVDIVIWCAVVAALGLLVERVTGRLSDRTTQ